MRVQNRYVARRWFKKWMLVICVYPICIIRALSTTNEEVRDILFEWDFRND